MKPQTPPVTLTEITGDALDRLIIADTVALAPEEGDVLILDDATHALTAWALQHTGARIFVRHRSYTGAHQLYQLAQTLNPALQQRLIIAGFTEAGTDHLDLHSFLAAHRFKGCLALGRLPKSHGALADWAKDFSRYIACSEASMILGGNTKHMSTTFNRTLARFFDEVGGLRGKGKHRCLLASQPQHTVQKRQPAVAASSPDLLAYGGVFSGSKADQGGQLLAHVGLNFLQKTDKTHLTVLDLGCGNGSVSKEICALPQQKVAQIIASDVDADAVRSARANLPDSRVQVMWDDAAAKIADSTVDLVLLNPPFHEGTRVDLTLVQPLLDAAHRVLAPGGVLLLVHNSHARYRGEVEQRFGTVHQVTRNKTFTVLKALAR